MATAAAGALATGRNLGSAVRIDVDAIAVCAISITLRTDVLLVVAKDVVSLCAHKVVCILLHTVFRGIALGSTGGLASALIAGRA